MAVDKKIKDLAGNYVNPITTASAVRLNDNDESDTLDEVLSNVVKDISVLVGTTGWITSGSGEYTYYKEYTIEDIRATDAPLYILTPAGVEKTNDESQSFSKILGLDTFDGSIRLYVNQIPTTSITITLKSIPNRSVTV